MEEHLKKLVERAAQPGRDRPTSIEAMQLAQAALNVAQTLRVLEDIRVSKLQNPQ